MTVVLRRHQAEEWRELVPAAIKLDSSVGVFYDSENETVYYADPCDEEDEKFLSTIPLVSATLLDPAHIPIDDSQTERPRAKLFDAADPTVDSLLCYSRPKYIFASACVPDRWQKIGIIFGNREAGGICIKKIADNSPFQNSNVQVGDHVISINSVLCSKIKANRVIELIHSTRKYSMVSLCVHNEKGDPETVSCSVQKAHPQAKVGVTLQTRRGAVRVNRVDLDGLFGNSLLMPHYRCIIINGVSCCHMNSKQAADLIKSLSDRVTIVSRPQEHYAMTLALSQKTKWWRRFGSRAGKPVKAFASTACIA